MHDAHIVWEALDWEQGQHPLEHKKTLPGQPCVLLMFMPGFADPNLCQRSHVLHVLSGVLTLELTERVARCAAGETFVLAPGSAHRARNDGTEPVVLLAVSDLG